MKVASFCSWVSRDSAGRAKGLGLGSFETCSFTWVEVVAVCRLGHWLELSAGISSYGLSCGLGFLTNMVDWAPKRRVERGRWSERRRRGGRDWWKPCYLYGTESHTVSLLQQSVGQSSYKVHLVSRGGNTDPASRWRVSHLWEGISNGIYVGAAIFGKYTLLQEGWGWYTLNVAELFI